MTDKNKDAQLKEAEAKNVSGGMWLDRVRANQTESDGTSITPPSPTTGVVDTNICSKPVDEVKFWGLVD